MGSVAAKQRFQEAITLHKGAEVDGAIAIYRELLGDDPSHAGAWHLLGVALQSQGDHSTALECIERALALCATKAVYWNNYAVILRELGRLREAVEALCRALSIRGDYADALANLGLCSLDAGEYGDAETRLREALRHAPHHTNALLHVAECCRANR